MHSSVSQVPAAPWRGNARMQDIKTEHELLADAMHRIAARLAACRTVGLQQPRGVDAFASAAAEHLADIVPDELPLAARTVWADRIARPLKADAAKPLTEQGLAPLRSWPAARLQQFSRALAEIERIVNEVVARRRS